ncbi:NAD-dependent epimerase/dehydratase family protein [Gilvimarinus sp. SDUM040013]|uniref:NAD-dependent epimerase/dehydratase family protein n=1 Tax=Gilvimarinus gilvus TaxID=3058038 RepID=A0ABU4RX88_9GAMM|nr:NAD-dependent epimerase/dehydratase family protein [Gilvimarinus sp. SDUM040013]MDO3388625.1 NAD-dependent epimerase/dehydratase family protein [Gilvimarinus sp. SDUM040013]MDX6849520.1 NAD-dependent epimerase/dehydratase family protein [Gilvimarinus sp. SDUM040013]
MDSEKLLIIGCGDLGRRLAHNVCQRPVRVTGIKRHVPAGLHPAIQYVAADYTDVSSLRKVLSAGFDRIVLTPTPVERSDDGYRRGYVSLCENLVSVLRGVPQPRQIVFVSSTSVYGQSDGSWVDEDSLTIPSRYAGTRVLEAENVLRNAKLPVTVARLAGIYGPGRERLLGRVRDGLIAPASNFTNRIHVEDAARALDFLLYEMQQPESVYLVSDGEAPTQAEVVRWLAERLQVQPLNEQVVTHRNKRIDSGRLRAAGFECRYPTFRAGFSEIIPQSP